MAVAAGTGAARRSSSRRSSPRGPRAVPSDTLCAAVPGRPTLEAVVSSAWNELSGHAATSCILCGGRMEPRYGAGPDPVGGRCRDCGSSLE